jgi:hypothetical protein
MGDLNQQPIPGLNPQVAQMLADLERAAAQQTDPQDQGLTMQQLENQAASLAAPQAAAEAQAGGTFADRAQIPLIQAGGNFTSRGLGLENSLLRGVRGLIPEAVEGPGSPLFNPVLSGIRTGITKDIESNRAQERVVYW